MEDNEMTLEDWKEYNERCLQDELEMLEWLKQHNRYKHIKRYIKKYKK